MARSTAARVNPLGIAWGMGRSPVPVVTERRGRHPPPPPRPPPRAPPRPPPAPPGEPRPAPRGRVLGWARLPRPRLPAPRPGSGTRAPELGDQELDDAGVVGVRVPRVREVGLDADRPELLAQREARHGRV